MDNLKKSKLAVAMGRTTTRSVAMLESHPEILTTDILPGFEEDNFCFYRFEVLDILGAKGDPDLVNRALRFLPTMALSQASLLHYPYDCEIAREREEVVESPEKGKRSQSLDSENK